MAAQNGWTAVVAALIAANANLDLRQKDGATAVYVAAQNGCPATLAALIEGRAKLEDEEGARHGTE